MKPQTQTSRCPACGRTYSDPTQTFCLEDGNRLVASSASSSLQPTIASSQPVVPPIGSQRASSPPETVLYSPGVMENPAASNYEPARRGKAHLYSLIFAIVSLVGPVLEVIGLFLNSLAGPGGSDRPLAFGFLAGVAGLTVGLVSAIVGLKLGRKAQPRALVGITLSVISIVISILLFLVLLFTTNLQATMYQLTGR